MFLYPSSLRAKPSDTDLQHQSGFSQRLKFPTQNYNTFTDEKLVLYYSRINPQDLDLTGLLRVLHLRSVCSCKKVLSHIPLHFLLAFYRTGLLSRGGRGVAALAWSVPNPSLLSDPFYDQSRHWRILALKASPAHSGFPGTTTTTRYL